MSATYTAEDVAVATGRKAKSVTQALRRMGRGTKVGNRYVLTQADLDAVAQLRAGRPRKGAETPPATKENTDA